MFAIFITLSACGGSGSSESSRPNLPPTSPAPSTGDLDPLFDFTNVEVYGDLEVQAGSAAGFAVIPKAQAQIASIRWEQTSGPALAILAANSQTVGFDVPQSGNYTLSVSVQMLGETQTNTYNVDFSADNGPPRASARLDHTATELSKVSLHVGIPENQTIESVTWTQLAGPQAQNVEKEDAYLFFNAPSVLADSVLLYRAEVNYTDGTSESDEVLVTVKNVSFDTSGLFYSDSTIITEDMHAYRSTSPFKSALERCVYGNNIPYRPTCTFQELPLLGMSTVTPSVDDVLNRTLVSHQWMGDRFADYLQNSAAGPDILNLLRGVTAVVISYDVRPSFYWVKTGAIYLDANNFWQSPAERDTLNDQPDYRSDFGSDLQFSVYWRYTKDNEYYPKARIEKQSRVNRDFADLEASISYLMYHELGHANDFFPPDSWAFIARSTTPLRFFEDNYTRTSSVTLKNNFPLRSDEMHALAQVRFNNETATASQRAYRGTDIEGFFEPDIAASFYSYLNEREDFATLVERFLMLYRLDAEADVAIIDGRTADDEALVVWGQRNRISEDSLEDRTVYAVSRVYPELGNIRTALRALPSPILMTPNKGWFENLEISPVDQNVFSNTALTKLISPSGKPIESLTAEQLKQQEEKDSKAIHGAKRFN